MRLRSSAGGKQSCCSKRPRSRRSVEVANRNRQQASSKRRRCKLPRRRETRRCAKCGDCKRASRSCRALSCPPAAANARRRRRRLRAQDRALVPTMIMISMMASRIPMMASGVPINRAHRPRPQLDLPGGRQPFPQPRCRFELKLPDPLRPTHRSATLVQTPLLAALHCRRPRR